MLHPMVPSRPTASHRSHPPVVAASTHLPVMLSFQRARGSNTLLPGRRMRIKSAFIAWQTGSQFLRWCSPPMEIFAMDAAQKKHNSIHTLVIVSEGKSSLEMEAFKGVG